MHDTSTTTSSTVREGGPGTSPTVSAASGTKPLLTVEEFHRALGGAIGKNTLYELLRANRIRHVRLGRKILIPAGEVDAFPDRETQLN